MQVFRISLQVSLHYLPFRTLIRLYGIYSNLRHSDTSVDEYGFQAEKRD